MATKFGYVKREATNAIDWSAVASQFTNVLKEEASVREQKKAERFLRQRDFACLY